MKDIDIKYMTCECMSPEHTLRYVFLLDENPAHSQITTEVHMTHYLPWWKRVVAGIRYIFGYQSDSHYDTFVMRRGEVKQLREMLQGWEAMSDGLADIEANRTEEHSIVAERLRNTYPA